MMKKISDKILQKIEKEKIEPLPKWHFWLKDDLIWILAGISTLIGSLATAAIIHIILNRDWFIYHAAHHPSFTHLVLDLPFLWIVLFFLTIWIAYFQVEHSKTGYRYNPFYVVIGSLAFSLAFGLIFNVTGLGFFIDRNLSNTFPVYRSVEKEADELWLNVRSGYLGGQITKIEKNTLELRDSSGKIWQVDISKTDYCIRRPLKTGDVIKIIGKEMGKNKFEAFEIHFWASPLPRKIFIHQQTMLSAPLWPHI